MVSALAVLENNMLSEYNQETRWTGSLLLSSPFNHKVIQMHLNDGLDVTWSLAIGKA